MSDTSGRSSDQHAASTAAATNDKFPTVGLKSLLQNSDLLDILLKPLSSDQTTSSESNKGSSSRGSLNLLESTDLDSLIDAKTKSLFDFEVDEDFLESNCS